MEKPAIELVEELYTADESKAMVERFREDGFVILPDVFKRETVEPFLSQLEELMFHDGLPWRLRTTPPIIHIARKPPEDFNCCRMFCPDPLSSPLRESCLLVDRPKTERSFTLAIEKLRIKQ